MLWMYPHPEVLGLSLDRNQSARVVSVAPDSAAARAGLQTDDHIVSFAGQPLVSIADFQWVLHITPDEGGKVPITVLRNSGNVDLEMELAPLWRRKGDFGWRYRVAGYAAWLWGGVTLADQADGVLVASRSPGWFKNTNRDARRALNRGDVIVEVDGKTGHTRSTYLAYLMREKKPGSAVKLKVRRNGKTTRVVFRIPAKRPEVQGH
jgi:C-terminal processing protease CtpA/Prc